MRRAEIVQSMRAGSFGGFVVLGSQYRDGIGELHWYVALLPEQTPGTKIYHITAGEMPDELMGDERHAVIEAIRSWEAQPASQPN
jgi:hypothetical protein